MSGDVTVNSSQAAWERQPDEPVVWFERFDVYRSLGPGRTIAAAYRAHGERKESQLKKVTGDWYTMANRHHWRQRAEQFDRAERKRLREVERERAMHAHRQRLAMIDELLGAVFSTLQIADLEGMDSSEARSRLPAIRMLFKDLLSAQRDELGMPDDLDEAASAAPFTADELLAAQRELRRWQQDDDTRAA